ncbi:MAG: hypothetical protein IPJ90_02690 [Anaerolineaceae bacterium]|nr:hypothetical protein [Anaerolineaceae bacterium]
MRHQRWIQWIGLSSLILILAACATSAGQESEQALSAAEDPGEQTAVVAVAPVETSAPTPEPTTPVEDSPSSMPDAETAVITSASSGEFVIASAYITTTVRDSSPPHDNAAFLVISLTRPDGTVPDYTNLSLETFENEQMDLQIEFLDPTAVDAATFPFLFNIADNRYITICNMGGWLDEAFVQVCTIPNVAAEYSLVWADNPPILITPDGVE